MQNLFEKFPELAKQMEVTATHGTVPNWGALCSAINAMIRQSMDHEARVTLHAIDLESQVSMLRAGLDFWKEKWLELSKNRDGWEGRCRELELVVQEWRGAFGNLTPEDLAIAKTWDRMNSRIVALEEQLRVVGDERDQLRIEVAANKPRPSPPLCAGADDTHGF